MIGDAKGPAGHRLKRHPGSMLFLAQMGLDVRLEHVVKSRCTCFKNPTGTVCRRFPH